MEEWVITTAITMGIGIITYFLKRTMNRVDKQEDEVRRIDVEMVSRTDLKEGTDELKSILKEDTEELKEDIRKIREDYTPKETHQKDFDECRLDIKQIKTNYLTKEDFIREIGKMDKKLDRLMELMIEDRRGT